MGRFRASGGLADSDLARLVFLSSDEIAGCRILATIPRYVVSVSRLFLIPAPLRRQLSCMTANHATTKLDDRGRQSLRLLGTGRVSVPQFPFNSLKLLH